MRAPDQILRSLARARRQQEQLNTLLRVPPEKAKAQAKKRQALEAKLRASVRRAVAEYGAGRAAHQEQQASERVLRVAEVMKITGLGRTTLWKLEREGHFPKRTRLTGRAVGWRASDVARWVADGYSICRGKGG